MKETGQRLTSHSRADRLTEDEMKRLVRLLSFQLPVEYVRFPHREPTVAVELIGYTGAIPAQLAVEISRVIGDYELDALSG